MKLTDARKLFSKPSPKKPSPKKGIQYLLHAVPASDYIVPMNFSKAERSGTYMHFEKGTIGKQALEWLIGDGWEDIREFYLTLKFDQKMFQSSYYIKGAIVSFRGHTKSINQIQLTLKIYEEHKIDSWKGDYVQRKNEREKL
jgi:hypothetical protein